MQADMEVRKGWTVGSLKHLEGSVRLTIGRLKL